jgi:hypothetical protein
MYPQALNVLIIYYIKKKAIIFQDMDDNYDSYLSE